MYLNFLSHPYWQYAVFSNTMQDYAIALVTFVVLLLIFKIIRDRVLGRLMKLAERTATDIDDTLIHIVKSIRPPFYLFLATYFAFRTLALALFFKQIILVILVVLIGYQAAIAIQIFIEYIVRRGEKKDPTAANAVKILGIIAKGVLWTIIILLLLSNFGVNITSLIAGLGIGGVAIALALQNILSDLFSSFAIYFDKPFEIGDFVIVGSTKGTVERIGIKTTRIRSLQGEEIVMSNRELTSATIQNFKKMRERRVVFSFGVTYETPTEKVKRIPEIVQNIVKKESRIRLDRVHFTSFGDSALLFEVVYYINSSEYNIYMDIQQAINLFIKNSFEQEKINMAYPTQTIYVKKNS